MAVFFPPLTPAAGLALRWPTTMQIGWEILGANFHLSHSSIHGVTELSQSLHEVVLARAPFQR